MLRAVGMGDDDFAKPQIGVASSRGTRSRRATCRWTGSRKAAKDGVHAAGGYPLEFGTISVSDGISMGHEGMHFSLVSREVIADSVETVMQAERLDGSVLLAGCDKSLPGHADGRRPARPRQRVPLRRLDPARDREDVRRHRAQVTIIDAFEAVGACARGLMSREDVDAIERAICPGEGACGGMYTANTMASAAEALGMSLPGSAAPPATDRRRDGFARRVRRGRGRDAAPRHHRPRHHDPRGVRERHRRRDGVRRLDQRRAAPAGDRARGRGRR